jgi:hypothetical protein
MFAYDLLGSISRIQINQQEFPSRLIEIYTNLVTILYIISRSFPQIHYSVTSKQERMVNVLSENFGN